MSEVTIGSDARPLRVAIVGAGPSGFYAAAALLNEKELSVEIDILDRLPTPFGLVRHGVAPDHQKIKSVERAYHRTASHPNVRFYGNVEFGRDVTRAEMRQYYDQIVYAVGAPTDRRLNIPGESLRGSVPATEFVAWYNGHPDYTDLDFVFDGEEVVVVGNGNVAVDVTRILAKPVELLENTDIADHALERLRESRVKRIHMLGRRGPAQAKFTNPELRELGEIEGVDVIVDPADLELDPLSREREVAEREVARNMATLRDMAASGPTGAPRQIHIHFFASPIEVVGSTHVEGVRVERNRLETMASGYQAAVGTGESHLLPAQWLLRAVGYFGVALPDLPFDPRRGTLPNREGRLFDPEGGAALVGEYAAGWAKRGPTGVIGTNKADATETVRHMVADIGVLSPVDADRATPAAAEAWLREAQPSLVTYDDWSIIDRVEKSRGEPLGRPRQKICTLPEMIELIMGEHQKEGA